MIKLSFSEFCDSKFSGLRVFDDMAILLSLKRVINQKGRLWVHETHWSNFCDPHWELICRNKWQPGISTISTPLEITIGTHFHVRHETKTILIFLAACGKGFWPLLPRSIYLLSGGKVQPENTYSCILKVQKQVWEKQKRWSIDINLTYRQFSSP